MDYSAGLKLQSELLDKVQNSSVSYFIGLEHPAVITLGYRATLHNDIQPQNVIAVEKISRGGFATLHSEGQLVIYPVLSLRNLQIGVREYIYLLLESTQNLLQLYGVSSFINPEALGLYTSSGKIAFCGIQVSRGITQHGISINVANDLSLFQNIRSCGCEAARFDRLADHAEVPELALLYSQWMDEFKKLFAVR